MQKRAAINGVLLLVLAVCLILIPYAFAAGTKLVIEPGGPNITFNKTTNVNPANASTALIYYINITVYNMYDEFTNISDMTVTENYSQDVIFVSSEPTALAGTNNTFIIGNITNGTNTTIQVNITVMVRNITNGTIINNTANISFFVLNSVQYSGVLFNITNVTESTTVSNPPLLNFTNISITKTDLPDSVNASTNLVYQINVSNTGNGTAYNVTVNDTYPAQVIYLTALPSPTASNNTWSLGTLTVGTNFSINITVLVLNISNGTVINNTANVTYNNETSGLFSRIATQGTTVNNPPAINFTNISITKTDSLDPANSNANFTYQINVSVTGNISSFNVTVNDTYPNEVIYQTSQPTPLTGTNNTWILGNLTNGTNMSINITVFVRNIINNSVINNTANVTYNNETGQRSAIATQATTILNLPATNTSTITVTKTVTPNPVGINTQLTYVITVNSSGNGTAFNVTVNDTYPSQLVLDSVAPAAITGTNNSWLFNMTPGTIILINITMNVSALGDGTVLTNSVNTTYQNETGGLFSTTASASTSVSNPAVQPGGSNGGGGGGGGGSSKPRNTTTASETCFESWTCGAWSACENNAQSRECSDMKSCGTTKLKPKLSQACTVPAPKPAEPVPQLAAEPAPVFKMPEVVLQNPETFKWSYYMMMGAIALIFIFIVYGIVKSRKHINKR